MKNNKGFISVTVIYAFFLVFLTLMLYIVTNMAVNRNFLNNMKKTIKSELNDSNFSRYLINHYEEDGIKLIRLNSTNYTYGIDDNSYRFTGANPNNYVKFKDSDELYRIIGIFNEKVKLVKATSWKALKFNTTINNNYIASNIFNNLNIETDSYLASLGNNIKYIDNENWYVGGIDGKYISQTGKNIAIMEVGDSKNNGVVINAKIGIIYLSDYIYAEDSSDKTNYGKNITKTNNWLFLNNSWFITRNTIVSDTKVYSLNSDGAIINSSPTDEKNVRPTFYLKNNVRVISGSGTSLDPYVIGD